MLSDVLMFPADFHKASSSSNTMREKQSANTNHLQKRVPMRRRIKKCRKTGYSDSSPLGRQERGGVDSIQTSFMSRDRMEVVGQTSWEGQPRKVLSGMGVSVWGWEVFGNIEKGIFRIGV